MSTSATATDGDASSDDYFDAAARELHRDGSSPFPDGSATAAGAAATFDPSATRRLPNTTDGANQVVR